MGGRGQIDVIAVFKQWSGIRELYGPEDSVVHEEGVKFR